MCGIVGAVAQRNVVPILVEGLKRLEYRGYDSAGLAVLGDGSAERLDRVRAVGKVKALEDSIQQLKTEGQTGIAHTRWATHGVPSEDNAHPHVSHGVIAVVHNGIIENHEKLRKKLQELGYEFTSQTDTEVVAHLVHHHLKKQKDLCKAAMAAIDELEGAYALGIISRDQPHRLIAARKGSPLVVGVGIEEHFIGSDVLALAPVTHNVIYLEEGDVADLRRTEYTIYDAAGKKVERPVRVSEASADSVDRGQYRNFTEKEIFEQPKAVADTLEGRLGKHRILEEAFGVTAGRIFDNIKAVQIIACGTSFHAGSVARYWIESLAGLPCNVEIASEYRYRKHVVLPDTLVVTISQSGETADTLAALQQTKKLGYGHSLAICNVPESSLVRESELTLLTRAGPEIGVASTKAFTTQLAALLLLTIALARRHGLTAEKERNLVEELEQLPGRIQKVLELSEEIRSPVRALRGQAPRPVPRARRALPDRHGRRAQAEGNLLHPRRGLRRRRTEARPAGAGGCRHAGDCRRAQRRAAGKTEIEPAGSARPRRRAVRVLGQGHRRACRQHHQDPHARGRRMHLADSLHRAAATAGLLRRAGEGHRRGSAA